jgi:hypothetical protein
MNPETSPQAQGTAIVPQAAQAAPRTIDAFLASLRNPRGYVIKYGLKSDVGFPLTYNTIEKTLEGCTRRQQELTREYASHKFRVEEIND